MIFAADLWNGATSGEIWRRHTSAASVENLGVVLVGLLDRDEVEHDEDDDDFDEDVEKLGIGGGREEEIDFLEVSTVREMLWSSETKAVTRPCCTLRWDLRGHYWRCSIPESLDPPTATGNEGSQMYHTTLQSPIWVFCLVFVFSFYVWFQSIRKSCWMALCNCWMSLCFVL